MKNILAIPGSARPEDGEYVETILTGGQGLRVERIISQGQVTPAGEWYDQEQDEWVAVLAGEARLAYPDGSELTLGPGDHVLLPRHARHRVAYTSSPCFWLAVHGDLT